MRRCIGLVVLLTCAMASWAAAPPVPGSRGFTKEQLAWLTKTNREIDEHAYAGRFEEAEKLSRERLALRHFAQGRDHWKTRDARSSVEEGQRLTKVPAQQREAVGRSIALTSLGAQRLASGQSGEALKLVREALAIREKALGENHPSTAESYHNVAACLNAQGKSSESLPLLKRALAIREKTLGEGHPTTATSYNSLAHCLLEMGKPSQALPLQKKALTIRAKSLGERHPDTAQSYNGVASALQALGKASEALPLFRTALDIWEKTLGENHPDTATAYYNVASCLRALGKRSEALLLSKKSLAIFQKTRGENHPDTASSYNSVAGSLQALGKFSEALPLYKKALAIYEKALGENHPYTATCYNNVASCLGYLGKASEALPLYRRALAIQLKTLGENHPDTAESYNGVGLSLEALGKSLEALPLLRKGLAITEKTLGEGHPDTAAGFSNVAYCLKALGKVSEALPLLEKALAIREKTLGGNHPDTADSYNSVAVCLNALAKPREALPLFRRALVIRAKCLGEGHPDTATSYNNVAHCLEALGKHSEALPLYQKALAIYEKSLGENHPQTATTYNNVALCLWRQGEVPRALRLWQRSLAGQEAARFQRGASGFDRAWAEVGHVSPRALLAAGLAQLGQPVNAFAHVEASLARGLLDDLESPGNEDVARLRALQSRLDKLDAALVSFAGLAEPTTERRAQHDIVLREHRAVVAELTQLVADDSARRILPLWRIQKAIGAEAALVLWIDVGQRWACVLRGEGTPRWARLPGNGKGGNLTEDDRTLPNRMHLALTDPATLDGERRKLSAAFVKHLFDPLGPHLKGVKRLFVVPSGPLAKVPLEALTSDYSISYVPSGSVLTRLVENHRAMDGSSLLAVGDPIFDPAPPAEPPSSGVMVLSVVVGSHAAKAGLQAGDVLLSIGTVRLDSFEDATAALEALPAKAMFWREGKTHSTRLQGSPLGAVFDPRSARAAVRVWRKEREAVATRGTGHKHLPGTCREVEAISALVKSSTALLGSEASEQKLDELQAQGKLKGFRIIHIATHGETDERSPGRSALILAQDRLPDALEQARQGKHVYDGRLTVSRIRNHWTLDADLVVLSACETGLGKEAGGDGLLGFAQAFLSKGARSVVLSRWKVDDTATALLMIRFYENLLGKRKDLKKAMGRAAALDEAKKWLRSLTRQDAERLATLHSGGVLRGSEGDQKAPEKLKPVELKGDKPFAHPFYWAAFTLIGDPD